LTSIVSAVPTSVRRPAGLRGSETDRFAGRPAPAAATAPDESAGSALLAVEGAGLAVPLVGGGQVEYANLDYAASAPCLAAVAEHVGRVLPYPASVHRGEGFASQVCTAAVAWARRAARRCPSDPRRQPRRAPGRAARGSGSPARRDRRVERDR
jgi:hypothetical protein